MCVSLFLLIVVVVSICGISVMLRLVRYVCMIMCMLLIEKWLLIEIFCVLCGFCRCYMLCFWWFDIVR